MKRFGFGVRFAALLAAIAAVIVLLVLVIGNRARKGRTGLPLDEETGLLGSADGHFVGWQRGQAPAAQAEQLALELADRLLARRKEACGQ